MFTLRTLFRTLPAFALVGFQVILAPAAMAAPGDLDPTFGIGGKVTADLGADDEVIGMTLQPDGKIVVVARSTRNPLGTATSPSPGSRRVAFSTQPSGRAGWSRPTSLGGVTSRLPSPCNPMAEILVSGRSDDGFDQSTSDFALARYNNDGSLGSDLR